MEQPQTRAVVSDEIDDRLERQARAHGVATTWLDQLDRSVPVSATTVRAVLDALGVGADESEIPLESKEELAITPLPPGPRGWGFAVQLYALRSEASWGIGEFADLAALVRWTAAHGGDLILVNPLHAVAMIEPIQPSPYYPASRQWLNPIYLRIEDLPEYHAIEPVIRRHVDALKPVPAADRIDRDAVWQAKQQALALLFDPADVAPPSDREVDFATWSSLVEVFGADWRTWPEAVRRPDGIGIGAIRDELAERMLWHVWLQRRADEQCRAAQQVAKAAGMTVGIVHDLAVGADPGGADAWTYQDLLPVGVRIGAPPDEFNQQGQDWGMSPWHPRRLAAASYLPIREMVRAQLHRGGGLRIDHVLGLFRMWWIPEGRSPSEGTYVSYDAAALLAVITEEAAAAGALIVGEDLGVVQKPTRAALASAGVLGTSLLLFERDDPADGSFGPLRPPGRWREAAMASVTTHDLPTPLAWLRGDHVRLRASLGQLSDPGGEFAVWRRERDELVTALVAAGLAKTGDDDVALAGAMQRALTLSPSRWIVASPGEAVGDLRQANLPGTTDEYPNWRLPLTDLSGHSLQLEELLADPRLARLAADLDVERPVRER